MSAPIYSEFMQSCNNFPNLGQLLPKIRIGFVQSLPKIRMGFVQSLPKILMGFVQSLPKIHGWVLYSRYLRY